MFSELQNIYMLMEDYNSSINQAKSILKNNGVQDYEQIVRQLESVYNSVRFEDDEHKNARKDQDIPSLAFLILAGWNINRISELYNKYCNTKSLYMDGYLAKWSQSIRETVQKNKWFKPSEEKTKYFQEESNKLVEAIHSNYVPPENRIDNSTYESNDDDIVFENDKLLIYKADSMDKCILYGEKNLCISYPKKDNYYWRYRLGKMRGDDKGMTTYFVNWKDGSNKILIDALGDEDGGSNEYSWNPISNNVDSDISREGIIKMFPELKEPFDENVFVFIEYGDKESRVFEIDENINSILDSKLRGFSDYDIFVQLDKDISDSDWNELNIDNKTKSILFKKYMGGGGLVSLDNIKKYGSIKDLEWYEDILSRRKDRSIRYYLSVGGKVSNPKLKERFLEEKKRVDKLETRIRSGERPDLDYKDLYILPNISDIVWDGDFICDGNNLTSLEGAPQKVGGVFYCSDNKLTSLEGAPQMVGGDFYCDDNNLTSLEGAPQKVGGGFYCSSNDLTSLEGAPQVGGDFYCDNNKLISLKGAPQMVGGNYYCNRNKLTSLEGAPQMVGGVFDYSDNNLTSLEGEPETESSDMREWGEKFKVTLKKQIKSEIDSDNSIKEQYGFNYLLNRSLEILEETVSRPIDRVSIKKLSKEMERIERKNFSQYFASAAKY